MSSSGIIALLMLGILATSIIPTDARLRSLRKKYLRSPSRRQDVGAPDEEEDSQMHLLPRIPITKSLARKLSEMLAVAVAEAVAQVVDDEPGRITACDALLRLRRSNNQNINFNKNVNKNIMKKQKAEAAPDYGNYLAARMGAETDDEDNKSAPTESEEAVPDADEVIEDEVTEPPPQQRRRNSPYAKRRKQRNPSINTNYNDNKNVMYVRRTDQISSKNATDTSSVEDVEQR